MQEVKYLGQGNIARYSNHSEIIQGTDIPDGALGVTGGAYLFETEDYQLHLNQYALNGDTLFVCHEKEGIPVVEELPIDQLTLWQ